VNMPKLALFLGFLLFLSGCENEELDYPKSNYGYYLKCVDENYNKQVENFRELKELKEDIYVFCSTKWTSSGNELSGRSFIRKDNNNDLTLYAKLYKKNTSSPETILSRVYITANLKVPMSLDGFGECQEEVEIIKLHGWSDIIMESKNDLSLIKIKLDEIDTGKEFSEFLKDEDTKCVLNWMETMGGENYIPDEYFSWDILKERYLNLNQS